MASDKVIVVRGEVTWAKIVGASRKYTGNPKFDKGNYWSVDITPDAKSLAVIKAAGIEDKLRLPKGNDRRTEKYLSLTVLETKANGEKNDPPSIVDITGKTWDGSEIGNGSIMDIKIKVKDYGTTVGAYYQKGRVLSHVPYEGGGFEPLSEDDAFFSASRKPRAPEVAPDDDFDDSEVPF